MKYFFTVAIALFVFGFLLLSCNSSTKNNSNKSIDDLLEHFSKDFTVTNKSEMFYSMVGAIDGCAVDLNGDGIEIYKFDISDPGQKTIIENAKKTHTISLFGSTVPVLVNGSFILLNYTDHPDREKIKKVFEKFGDKKKSTTTSESKQSSTTSTALPSITVVNNTGYSVHSVYISTSSSESWGSDWLNSNEILSNNDSRTFTLKTSLNNENRYDIQLVDLDDDLYTKVNVLIKDKDRIVFTIDDIDDESQGTKEEINAIGRYSLSSITGIDGISAGSYHYNDFTLLEGGIYEIKNAIFDQVTEQSGLWSLKNGVLTLKTNVGGSTIITEEGTLVNNVITLTVENQDFYITMEFTKDFPKER